MFFQTQHRANVNVETEFVHYRVKTFHDVRSLLSTLCKQSSAQFYKHEISKLFTLYLIPLSSFMFVQTKETRADVNTNS